jgi:hypothetical protein
MIYIWKSLDEFQKDPWIWRLPTETPAQLQQAVTKQRNNIIFETESNSGQQPATKQFHIFGDF